MLVADDNILDERPKQPKPPAPKGNTSTKKVVALVINLLAASYGLPAIIRLRRQLEAYALAAEVELQVSGLKFKFLLGLIALIGIAAANYYQKQRPHTNIKYLNYMGLLINILVIILCFLR
mgnify:CR=1 FL=1